MKQLSESESALLTAWCKARKKLRKQSREARLTQNQLSDMDKKLRRIVSKANTPVSNGEWKVSYENKKYHAYTVPEKSRRLYTVVAQYNRVSD